MTHQVIELGERRQATNAGGLLRRIPGRPESIVVAFSAPIPRDARANLTERHYDGQTFTIIAVDDFYSEEAVVMVDTLFGNPTFRPHRLIVQGYGKNIPEVRAVGEQAKIRGLSIYDIFVAPYSLPVCVTANMDQQDALRALIGDDFRRYQSRTRDIQILSRALSRIYPPSKPDAIKKALEEIASAPYWQKWCSERALQLRKAANRFNWRNLQAYPNSPAWYNNHVFVLAHKDQADIFDPAYNPNA